MNKIKIIDLFNKIANGEEVPKRIKFNDVDYMFNATFDDYESLYGASWLLKEHNDNLKSFLNDEVEIIEEEKEIEKLKIEYDDGDIGINGIYLTSNHSEIFANKINELIDVVNELKRDKEC